MANRTTLQLLMMLSLVHFRCASVDKSRRAIYVPFKNKEWKMIYGKENDSILNFYNSPNEYFSIKFTGNKFRGFDGSFIIRGMAKDTNSVYYTLNPFVGFYKVRENNQIDLQWFSKITWTMNFNRSNQTRAIRSIFESFAFYDYTGHTMVLYQKGLNLKRDTIIVMKSI